MDDQNRQVIDGLFTRLGTVERQAGARDPGADAFIKERVAQQPASPYFMAQTIVMQDHALQQAQQRIAELERQQAERPAGGGFLSGLFGGQAPQQRPSGAVPAVPPAEAQQGAAMPQGQPARGSFLAGAAQTAMGVAGGMLLGNAIAGMFGGNEAKAADTAAAGGNEAAAEPAAEPVADEGGGFFDSFFGDGDEEV